MDLSEFITVSSPWHRCPVAFALEKVDKTKVEQVDAAFKHPQVLASRISELLSEWSDVKVSANAARRHRRGECSCD